MKIKSNISLCFILLLSSISIFAAVPAVKGWSSEAITMGTITNGSKLGNEVPRIIDRFNAMDDKGIDAVFTYSGQGGSETWNLDYVDVDQKIDKLYRELIPYLQSETNKIINPVVVIYTCGSSNGTDAIGWDLGIHAEDDSHITPAMKEMNKNNIKKWLYNMIMLADLMEKNYQLYNIRGTILLNPDFLGELHKIQAGYDWVPFDYNHPNIKLKTTLDYLQKEKNIRLPNYPGFITDQGTISDYLLTINWLLKVTAPDIPFGWMDNVWAGTSMGHKWLHHPEMLDQNIKNEIAFIKSLKIFNEIAPSNVSINADFIAFDKYERDNFGTDSNALNNGYTYNIPAWNTYFDFIAGVNQGIGNLPVMLFQTPGGHIQIQDDIDPRDQHGSTASTYIFGDPLLESDLSNIKPYLAKLKFVNPQNDYNFNSDSLREYLLDNRDEAGWREGHLNKLKNANVFAITWGGGNTTDISGLTPELDDNGWLLGRINNYYQTTN